MRTVYGAGRPGIDPSFHQHIMQSKSYNTYNPYKAICVQHMEQAVPGSILDEAPFFSIVDFQRFPVRLSTIGTEVGQAGGILQYGGP